MLWAGAERLVDVLLGYSIATLGVLSCACECKLLSGLDIYPIGQVARNAEALVYPCRRL